MRARDGDAQQHNKQKPQTELQRPTELAHSLTTSKLCFENGNEKKVKIE